jgi:Mn2+/Fe2+ NRAMP family transporter
LRNIFRWLSLALLAYVVSAFLARPEWPAVFRGTLIPTVHWSREYLSLVVAVIGTSLSAYLYTWKSNEEVEEKIANGQVELPQRQGTSKRQLKRSAWDIALGMFFSSAIMYFVMLSTASTLFKSGKHDIDSAAQAAAALQPLAGHLAGILFALGIIGVAFIAIPVMTTGAAYDLCQTFRWKHSLHAKPREAKRFYLAIVAFTLLAMGLNFIGINPMKALVFAGIVQGFSTPFLLFLIMRMTNNRKIVGPLVNSRAANWIGWATTAAVFAATIGLVITWFL